MDVVWKWPLYEICSGRDKLSDASYVILDTTTHGVEVRLASQWTLRTGAQSGYINGILLE